jgi:hypothetical protein
MNPRAAIIALFTFAAFIQSCTSNRSTSEHFEGPTFVYASQSGHPTIDQGEGGGNPFASALVELAGRDALMSDDFLHGLVELTAKKSGGLQYPDIRGAAWQIAWRVSPKPVGERRVALVLVFSDYTFSRGLASLPGARRDASRVSQTLTGAGFFTQTCIDPNTTELTNSLQTFTDISSCSQVALLYVTGHGVEVDGTVYLLPGFFPISKGQVALREYGIPIFSLGSTLHATHVNLLLYGGCRNNPLAWR